ncbi:hypothetical protein GCM10020358_54300 [Amorphoplanes nipponensis]|uniref:Uncharacterized protein n=1 Tax=Actinoplanes nipponensis TaxID=135950 RepID=A0A919JL59_9ACTN|nr:hypothetical protein [Actinoplanes nipponensis]GIE51166.1 hypothetical protein Ani05nite_47000 [Actinoplanes nipponensis]
MTGPENDGTVERRTPDYRGVVRKLTQLDDEAAAHRAEAHAWHDSRAREADEAVRAADERIRETQAAWRAAQRDREEVDARSAVLWAEFAHKVGRVAERFGAHAPQPAVPRQRDRDADDYLKEAEATAAWKPAPRKPTRGASLVYVVLGALGGAAGVAAWSTLRWAGRQAGGDWAAALPVVALVVALLGPILAVIGAKRVADRNGVQLDPSAVATVLIAGLIAAGLVLALARGGAAT